jgi:Ca-activated chloride channel homolog
MSHPEGIALVTASPAHRIALRGVRLRSRLSGMSQRTAVEQTFVNLEGQAIEAVYTFPLPEGAAVCGFEVVTGDRVLTGRIEESEQAIEQYEDAVSEGHGAFMMEQDRPDVFTVRVGNLKPHQAATIRLTYVCPLEKVDKSIRVSFPTTVAPRYVTDAGTDPLTAAIDGEAVNPPHVLHVPYGLQMEVEIDLGRDLRAVISPSHSVQVRTTKAGTALVTLSGGVTEMNRDIVLALDLKREHQPTIQAAAGKQGESFLAVTFVPEFDEDDLLDPPPAETVFVLDCSGSMQGDSIRQATAALELCLRSLSPGDTFNVCRFGSSFELMASEPLPYSQQTLERAIRYVRQNADLGGTELYAPLEAILKVPPRAGTVRQVILLTDGQVSNEPAVVELARKHRSHNRIFSFGIGAASSSYLVKGIARATGGAAEFITAGERIDDKVLRTFSRLSSPMIGDVAIAWGDSEVQTLAEIPPVFDGDVLSVFGRCLGRLPKEVTLSCTTSAGPTWWR